MIFAFKMILILLVSIFLLVGCYDETKKKQPDKQTRLDNKEFKKIRKENEDNTRNLMFGSGTFFH